MATFQYQGLVERVASTATAGGTTTLTITSAQIQVWTGTQNQTIVLPATNSYNEAGAKFEFYNLSTGSLTIQNSASTTLATVSPNTSLVLKASTPTASPGTWVQQATSSASTGLKNYLSAYTASTSSSTANTGNGNFEQGSTTGWSLQHSTLDSNNKLPNQASGSWTAANANLSISVVSSSQLAGLYSLSYASTTATTAGDMVVSSPFYIDSEDQSKVLGVSFAMKVNSGGTNGNYSGTISNSYSFAIYDVTNAAWIQPSNFYGVVQQAGTTVVTGTFQSTSNTTQYRIAFFNMNATSGASTIYLDDFFVGPLTPNTSSFKQPTIQIFSSTGSGTYTTPTNPVPSFIKIKMVGGGGGGGGSGTGTANTYNGTAGSATTFGSSLLTAGGGSGGFIGGYNAGGPGGGSYTINSPAISIAGINGSQGQGAQEQTSTATAGLIGGTGGNSPFFAGGGISGYALAGQAGVINTGGGGGGGGTAVTNNTYTGTGGGSGGYVEAIITNPSSSYSYTVGTGGTGGTASTSGYAGGNGGSGYIVVEEYYFQSQGSLTALSGTYTNIAPTKQVFTNTGSATYTTPTNPIPLYLKVRMVGGGGGGAASGTGGTGAGGNATSTTWAVHGGSVFVTAGGGFGAGTSGASSGGGSGGSNTISSPALNVLSVNGQQGLGFTPYSATSTSTGGGLGGSSPIGMGGVVGGGSAGEVGGSGNGYGGGGGGGGTDSSHAGYAGNGGGSGGYVEFIITNPSSSYDLSVGSGGSLGSAATNYYAGGVGANGIIVVEEYYTGGGAAANAANAGAATKYAPTIQRFTSGGTSGTYTTPTNPIPLYLKVTLVGGGGGGAGSGTSAGSTPGTGGNTTFGPNATQSNGANTTADGGAGATFAGSGAAGGSVSIGTNASATLLNVVGNAGSGSGYNADVPGGQGGSGFVGGAGGTSYGGAGSSANSNSGAGGSGGGTNSGAGGGVFGGPGGGAGGVAVIQINNPASSYNYWVGSGGGAGTAGASGTGGGGGANGIIIVEEYYQ